jgi:hypothetical protein
MKAESLRVLLGPLPCQGCRRSVVYGKDQGGPGIFSRRGRGWVLHRCPERL